jgi:hypothetical protein
MGNTQTAPTGGNSTLPNQVTATTIPAQQYGVSWTHVFNATTTMQVQYARTHVGDNTSTLFNNQNMWQVFGCSPSYCSGYFGGFNLMPRLTVTGGFTGGEQDLYDTNVTSTHEWSGSIAKTIRNHLLEAGGSWDEVNFTSVKGQPVITFTGAGTKNFSGNPGSAPGLTSSQISAQSGFGLADFLLDYPTSESRVNVSGTQRPGGVGGAYLQDSWKLTPSLTVNYGIRYDRGVVPAYGTEGTVGQTGGIETGDFDFNTGQYILQQLPPLCSVRGHAPCLPNATLPANVRVALGGKVMHGSKDNFGPRLGVAYRIRSTTSVRAGFGLVYDIWPVITQLPQNYQGAWPDTGTLQITNTNTPGTPYTSAQNPFVATGGNQPAATPFGAPNTSGLFVDPLWKPAYSEQYNFGIEQQLIRGTVLSVNYVGSESHRTDVGGPYNTGTPAVAASFAARGTSTGQPYSYIAPVGGYDRSKGSASYNSLQASVRGTSVAGLNYLVSYTWSKTLDEGTDGFFAAEDGVSEDPYNPKGSRGPAGYNIPQMFVVSAVYELPIGTGKAINTGHRVVDYVIGNWQLSGIFTKRSGQNFNVLAGGDIANTGNSQTYERANLVGDPYQSGTIAANPSCTPPAGPTRTRTMWFNPCAFVAPPIGTLGTSGRNFMQAQTFFNLDTALQRIFPIRENLALKLQFDGFNALNHHVFGTPGSTVTAPASFGVVNTLAFGNSNRILQGAIRLQF